MKQIWKIRKHKLEWYISKKCYVKGNYKAVIIMRFLLYQSIVPKIFLIDAILNTRHLLEL